MIVAGVLAPPAICHDQPFDNPTATDPHNLDIYDITGTAGVNGGAPIAYIVQDSCFEQNAATTADVILWPKTPLRGDDVVSRFICGTGGIPSGGWFSSLFIRTLGTAQTDYVYANFRNTDCYLGRRIANSSSDWTSNTSAPTMTAAGDVVELTAIGTSYWVVYETAAGVRTTICTYSDASGTYARGPGRRRAALRIGYSGGRSAWCDRWQFYDLPVWPVHAGLTKSGTFAYTSGWTAPTSWSVAAGYPTTIASGSSGVQMRGAGTVSASVRRATSASATGTSRVLVNGVVVWTGNQTTTASVIEQSSSFFVAAGDVVSVEFSFTAAATVAATTYLYVTPSAASIPAPANP